MVNIVSDFNIKVEIFKSIKLISNINNEKSKLCFAEMKMNTLYDLLLFRYTKLLVSMDYI